MTNPTSPPVTAEQIEAGMDAYRRSHHGEPFPKDIEAIYLAMLKAHKPAGPCQLCGLPEGAHDEFSKFVPSHKPAVVGDDEEAAWEWLEKRVEPNHPADVGYSADEMVDAFMAGTECGRTSPTPVGDTSEHIGRLLADDPVCGGRVTQDTVNAIAALVSPVGDEVVERVKPWLRHADHCIDTLDLVDGGKCRCGLDAAINSLGLGIGTKG